MSFRVCSLLEQSTSSTSEELDFLLERTTTAVIKNDNQTTRIFGINFNEVKGFIQNKKPAKRERGNLNNSCDEMTSI